jgi:hypothetical protein
VCYVTPAFVINIDAGDTNSGVTVTLGTDGGSLLGMKAEIQKFSKVTLYGGFLNGALLISTVLGDLNYNEYIFHYPFIKTQADLDTLAAAIKTAQNITYTRYEISCYGKNFIQPGTFIHFSSSFDGLVEAHVICMENTVDLMASSQRLVCYTALRFPSRVQTMADILTLVYDNASGTNTHATIDSFLAGPTIANNIAIQWRNAADNAWLECLKLDGSNKFQIGKDAVEIVLNTPAILKDYLWLQNAFLQANGYPYKVRNAANTLYLECFLLAGSDILEIGTEVASVKIRSTALNVRNAADNDYVDVNANAFNVLSDPVQSSLAELQNVNDINDHGQLPSDVKKTILATREVKPAKTHIDPITKKEVIDEPAEYETTSKIGMSVGAATQWSLKCIKEQQAALATLTAQLKALDDRVKLIEKAAGIK